MYAGIAIGGDVFPGSTLSDHCLRYEIIPQIKLIVVLGELGGQDEYSLVRPPPPLIHLVHCRSATPALHTILLTKKCFQALWCCLSLGDIAAVSAYASPKTVCWQDIACADVAMASLQVAALKEGKIKKPVVAWVSGTCAKLFKSEVQFGHAGAKSGGQAESAQVIECLLPGQCTM